MASPQATDAFAATLQIPFGEEVRETAWLPLLFSPCPTNLPFAASVGAHYLLPLVCHRIGRTLRRSCLLWVKSRSSDLREGSASGTIACSWVSQPGFEPYLCNWPGPDTGCVDTTAIDQRHGLNTTETGSSPQSKRG